MKAFIRYMISSNIGEVMSIFFASFLGVPDGFNSIQLLWVNLVTDGLPATALSFNPADPDVMSKKPREKNEALINRWTLVRFMVVGTYVGLATVGIFVYWYTAYDWAEYTHSLVSMDQLRTWTKCETWSNFAVENYHTFDFSQDPCGYFTFGKAKASTLSLSVLVMIEMLNALNALSEDSSIFKVGLFANPLLILACISSLCLHSAIMYVPICNRIFSITPLTFNDWTLVLAFSVPIIFIDEVLKIVSKLFVSDSFVDKEKKHN